MQPKQQQSPRIVIAGGGVAGLILATRLGRLLGRRGLAQLTLIVAAVAAPRRIVLHAPKRTGVGVSRAKTATSARKDAW